MSEQLLTKSNGFEIKNGYKLVAASTGCCCGTTVGDCVGSTWPDAVTQLDLYLPPGHTLIGNGTDAPTGCDLSGHVTVTYQSSGFDEGYWTANNVGDASNLFIKIRICCGGSPCFCPSAFGDPHSYWGMEIQVGFEFTGSVVMTWCITISADDPAYGPIHSSWTAQTYGSAGYFIGFDAAIAATAAYWEISPL
jgi:hypothetical protein